MEGSEWRWNFRTFPACVSQHACSSCISSHVAAVRERCCVTAFQSPSSPYSRTCYSTAKQPHHVIRHMHMWRHTFELQLHLPACGHDEQSLWQGWPDRRRVRSGKPPRHVSPTCSDVVRRTNEENIWKPDNRHYFISSVESFHTTTRKMNRAVKEKNNSKVRSY